jgi:hypothetical protein
MKAYNIFAENVACLFKNAVHTVNQKIKRGLNFDAIGVIQSVVK